ncbi:hypothetical protein OG216_47580 (plasmid) [Streptomycetaceae bacterium NBC_01309]
MNAKIPNVNDLVILKLDPHNRGTVTEINGNRVTVQWGDDPMNRSVHLADNLRRLTPNIPQQRDRRA